MANDPLGLQSNPLFGGIARAFQALDAGKARMNQRPAPGKMSPNYAQAMYSGEAANRGVGTPAKKSNVKAPTKGAAPVKKVKKDVVKAKTKGVKPNPFAKGKTEAPGMKSKGKKADKLVTMKKFVNAKKKK